MDQDQNLGITQSGSGKSVLPLVGGVIVVVVLGALGWYLLKGQQAMESSDTTGTVPATQSAVGEPDAATASLSAQGTSDETSAIDADLSATDLGSLDEINAL